MNGGGVKNPKNHVNVVYEQPQIAVYVHVSRSSKGVKTILKTLCHKVPRLNIVDIIIFVFVWFEIVRHDIATNPNPLQEDLNANCFYLNLLRIGSENG